MGFRNGAYAKIWSVEDKGNFTKVNLSTSKKIKDSNPVAYDTDFSSFVSLVGDAHKKAKETIGINSGDRIHILDCETTTKYDKAKDIKYTNHTIFDWEPAGDGNGNTSPAPAPSEAPAEPEEETDDDELPF